MSTHTLMRGALAAIAGGGAMLLAATTVQAAMAPSPVGSYEPSDVQVIGCDVGVHVGPIGACAGGHHDRRNWRESDRRRDHHEHHEYRD
jgi:hypothetical protein